MQVSYSRISTYKKCPFQYYLKYVLKLETYPNQDPDNALYLGTACHTGIQEGIQEMEDNYYSNYYIIDDRHVNEMIKLKYLIPKIRELLPEGASEVKIEGSDYIGYIDWLVSVGVDDDGIEWYDIYDFKYSNNVDNYLRSQQLHLYKYYFEKCNPTKRIRNLYFLFIPKTMVRQKKTEDLYQFRKRLAATLEGMKITKDDCIKKVVYDSLKIESFSREKEECVNAKEFPKNETRLCDWCQYKDFCKNGNTLDIMNWKGE